MTVVAYITYSVVLLVIMPLLVHYLLVLCFVFSAFLYFSPFTKQFVFSFSNCKEGTLAKTNIYFSQNVVSFPGLHSSLIPRPSLRSHSQAFTPVSFPGHHPSLIPRPSPQSHSQAFTPVSFPGLHPSLIPRPSPQLLSPTVQKSGLEKKLRSGA